MSCLFLFLLLDPQPVELNRRPYSKNDSYTGPTGANLQNRQFNTPIGMYSTEAITDTLGSTHLGGGAKSKHRYTRIHTNTHARKYL